MEVCEAGSPKNHDKFEYVEKLEKDEEETEYLGLSPDERFEENHKKQKEKERRQNAFARKYRRRQSSLQREIL